MYAANGQRKAYSQLAAIQIGILMDEGALGFDEARKAANDRDQGCFTVDWSKFSPAAARMMADIARLKATGDKAGAEALAARYVDDAKKHDVILDRMLRQPLPTFVNALDLE
jgi:hypothetical protein